MKNENTEINVKGILPFLKYSLTLSMYICKYIIYMFKCMTFQSRKCYSHVIQEAEILSGNAVPSVVRTRNATG